MTSVIIRYSFFVRFQVYSSEAMFESLSQYHGREMRAGQLLRQVVEVVDIDTSEVCLRLPVLRVEGAAREEGARPVLRSVSEAGEPGWRDWDRVRGGIFVRLLFRMGPKQAQNESVT